MPGESGDAADTATHWQSTGSMSNNVILDTASECMHRQFLQQCYADLVCLDSLFPIMKANGLPPNALQDISVFAAFDEDATVENVQLPNLATRSQQIPIESGL